MRTVKTKSKTRIRSIFFFFGTVAIIFILAFLGFFGIDNINGYQVKTFDQTINKGLDLRGGVSLIEQIEGQTPSDAIMQQTIKRINLRVNKMGVSETLVTKEDNNKIRIDVPGVYDTATVLKTVATQGKLEFRAPDKTTVILTGSDVKSANVGTDPNSAQPLVKLELNSSGSKKFADATAKYINQIIYIYMDNQIISQPTVDAVISDGSAVISGSMDVKAAKQLADLIQSGALPVTLKNVSARSVGATLGQNALPESITAGIIGIAIVMVFMLFYYRVPGIIANIALLLYVVLVLGTLSVLNATLTLSGIAGFLLTVGMAVDANVLIFERTKEELKSGKSIKSSIDAGFKRAMSSILDSNITTIISGIILYIFGTGTVKGFALTLVIGVLISLLTAVIVTRQLIRWAADIGFFSAKWTIGTFGVHDMRRGIQ